MIRYSDLWRDEHLRGQEEGVKDRPCAIVLVAEAWKDGPAIVVLPITHSPPIDASLAVEIPTAVKRHLGLDDARSWVVISEANRFVWPGPDLRPARSGAPDSVAYGLIPYKLFEQTRLAFIAALKKRNAHSVGRT